MAKRSRQPVKQSGYGWSTYLFAIGAGGLIAIVVVAVVLVFFAGGGGASAPERSLMSITPEIINSLDVDVAIVDSDYRPRDIQVPIGATVSWRNNGDLPHDVTEDRGLFKSDTMRESDTFEYKFTTAGAFFYYCTIHHKMLGSVTVTD